MKRQFTRSLNCIHQTSGPFFPLWLLVWTGLLSFWISVQAAAPLNDTCAGAEVINRDGPFPFVTQVTDITSATTAPSDPPITNSFLATRVIRSIWYRFTPVATALYTVSTCSDGGAATTVTDTVLGIFTSAGGCNGPFTPQGYGDEDCGPNSSQASVTTQLFADTTYYILIWKFCDGCTEDNLNSVQLVVSGSLAPPNDTCSGALPIHLNVPAEGTTVGAANNFQLSGTAAFWGLDQTPSQALGRDVVYSFIPPEAGTYSFRASLYDVNQNLVVYVVPSCPGTPPAVNTFPDALGAANRSAVNSAEEVMCLSLSAGQQVYVVVDDHNAGNSGSSFTLEVSRCVREQEPNNTPAQASRLSPGVEGSITPGFDMDFFALGRYPAGWRAFVLVDGEAARIANFDLRITTINDTLEYDDDNNDTAFGDSSPNVAGTPLTGESAFVLVNYFGNAEREPYRVFATVQPPLSMAVAETEPNNNPAQANLADQNYFYGTLSGSAPSTDVDIYGFSVAEGDLVFLSLDGDPHRTNAPVNARLELLDQSGNSLLIVNDTGATSFGSTNIATNTLTGFGPSSPAEGLIYRSGIEGIFYARVSASGNSAGRYLLSISKNGFTGADGFNHAPTFSNVAITSPIFAGSTSVLSGTVFEIDTGDAVSLEVNWGDGNTNVYNYSSAGRRLLSLSHQFTAGNYTVQLTARDQHGGETLASTTIQVKPLPAPARFVTINRAAGQIHLEAEGTVGASYKVEWCDVLGAGWNELGIRTVGAGGRFTIDDTTPAPLTRFYRAVAVP